MAPSGDSGWLIRHAADAQSLGCYLWLSEDIAQGSEMHKSLALTVIVLSITSCVVPPTDAVILTPSLVTPSPSSISIPTPTTLPSAVTPIPTQTAATPPLTLVPTSTIIPSPTIAPQATWNVDARRIGDWPGSIYNLAWETADLLGGRVYLQQAWRRIEVDVTGPELHAEVAADQPNKSSRGLYTIDRVDQQLVLSRADSAVEIARESSFVEACERLDRCLFWSPDLTAIAYLSPKGTVWIWETNGSPARQVGESQSPAEWLSWSPDSTMVTVLDRFAEVRDFLTYNVVFRDGTPMVRTGARITNRTEGPPIWVSNNLVFVVGDCGSGCSTQDYLEALSGKPLADATTVANFEGAWLSLDHRWLMSESASSPTYLMNDLQTGKQVSIADGLNASLDFVGWSDDSKGFFAVKRDLSGDNSVGLVSALVRYWPATDSWSLIADHVVQAIANEHRSRFLIVTYEPMDDGTYPLSVQLIDASGASLSDRYALGLEASNDSFGAVLTLARWNDRGETIIFATPSLDIATMAVGDEQRIVGRLSQPLGPEASILWSPADDRALFMVSELEAWVIQP